MKLDVKHEFFVYASNFTLKSMVNCVCYWSLYVFKNKNDEFKFFAKEMPYSVVVNKTRLRGTVTIAQTWLIDLLYELMCLKTYGDKEIDINESLHLISLYNNYDNKKSAIKLKNKKDGFLNLYGFLGEQVKFQSLADFKETFAREKYILTEVSYKSPPELTFGIDVKSEFFEETGFSIDEYSMLLFVIYSHFSISTHVVNFDNFECTFVSDFLNSANIKKMVKKYSTTVEEIKSSPLRRQIFYSKPFIQIDELYFASNPFLILCLFTNSIFWTMRNRYMKKTKGSQNFTSAFGVYFETYVKEILSNCLSENEFVRIPEDAKKPRADWYLKLGSYDILVEQKSSLSVTSIKQNDTDIDALKKHMQKHWKEAICQLDATEKAMSELMHPIKIILVYEEYYKSECLEELFRIDESLINDGKYWLVTIGEFETLLDLYHKKPEVALDIIAEKYQDETTFSRNGRDLKQYFHKRKIYQNLYLKDYNILSEQYENLVDQLIVQVSSATNRKEL